MGSIFRSSEGLGVAKIYCCGYTPFPLQIGKRYPTSGQTKLAKTALGAQTLVPWEHHRQTWRLFKLLKQDGVRIVGLERTAASLNITDFKPVFPMALLLGNEVKGLSKTILTYCDHVVEIPMSGRKVSFNVSVAFGIAAHAFLHL